VAEDAFIKVGHFKDVASFTAHLAALAVDLPCDQQILSAAQGSPLAQPLDVGGFVVGNRWCIHPMEGWDGTTSGEPTEYTLRRWQHFGESGAKLMWGGEAFAVQGDGRANPNQIGVVDDDVNRAERGAEALLKRLVRHAENGGIVLLHIGSDRSEPVAERIDILLDGLKARRFELVRASDFLSREGWNAERLASFGQPAAAR